MPATCTCQACGKSFTAPPSQHRKYCSLKCAYQTIKGSERAPRVTLHCLECGKEIRKRQEQADRGLGHFCSGSCRSKHYPHRHPLGTELAPHFEVPCVACGKPMRVTQAQVDHGKKFCSMACINQGREHPERRKAKVVKHCLACGKEFETFPSTAERHQYCSRNCHGYATMARQGRDKPVTSIEQAIMDELSGRGIAFSPQYHLVPWIIDVALVDARVAIECDGTFWHSLESAKDRDARKDADLSARGWTVFRFSEPEIRESPAKCVDKVLAYLAEHPA